MFTMDKTIEENEYGNDKKTTPINRDLGQTTGLKPEK
jgi:hypothetical protein